MSFANWFKSFTVQAKEDLDTHQYLAVALDDGKVANNGSEAIGILQNKPKTNEHATIAFTGIMKFRAGGAVAIGARMTVATSGFLSTAGSGDYIVGREVAAVTSGSIGTGLLDFTNPLYANTSDFIG